jgi:hypothetical protein
MTLPQLNHSNHSYGGMNTKIIYHNHYKAVMEIIKTKKGSEIVINRVDFQRLHIIFDNGVNYRLAKDNMGNINVLNIGNERTFLINGKVFFEKMAWNINSIKQILSTQNLNEYILTVSPIYSTNAI